MPVLVWLTAALPVAQSQPATSVDVELVNMPPARQLFLLDAFAEDESCAYGGTQTNGSSAAEAMKHTWFLELGAASNFTYLYESHNQLDRFLNRPLGWVPGYDPPRDFHDLRRAGQLVTGYVAIGRRLNEYTDLAFEFGGGAGQLRSSAEALPIRIATDLSYSTVIHQIGLRFYPFQHPVCEPEKGLANALAARPFIYQSFGISDITSTGEMGIGLRGLPSLMRIRLHREDWVWAYKLGGGIDIPVHSRVSVSVYGNYSFFLDRRREFDGFSVNVALKVYL